MHDMGRKWQFLIGTCLFKWLETPGVNWDGSILYLCEETKKLNVFRRQEVVFKFDAYFSEIFGILGKKPGGGGGLTPKGTITKPAHFIF